MASFVVETQRQDTELVGTSTIRDVMVVGAFTVPSNIYFEVSVPRQNYGTVIADAELEIVAESLEQIMRHDAVAGVAYVQDVNAARQIVNIYEITVTSTSGKSSMIVTYTGAVVTFATGYDPVAGAIDEARATLDAVEASGGA